MFERLRHVQRAGESLDDMRENFASAYGSNLLDVDSTKCLVNTSVDPIRRWKSLTSSIFTAQDIPPAVSRRLH